MAEPKSPKPPAQVEAEGDEDVVVEYAGHEYTFPASLDLADMGVVEAVDDQKMSYAIRGLLSEEDYEFFQRQGRLLPSGERVKPRVREARELFDEWAKRIGLEKTAK